MQNVMQALYLTRNARGLPASARRYSSPYKEMDIFRKSVLPGSMGCGFTYGDAYENASGQLTLTYKMPLEL